MKLIIAGSRNIKEYETVREALVASGLWSQYKHKLEIVCGEAGGVDTLGRELAERNGLLIHSFPADWKNLDAPGAVIRTNAYGEYNAKAGQDRNIAMGEFADAAIAIWDGSSKGTSQMMDWMQRAGKWLYVENLKTGRRSWYDKGEKVEEIC